MTAPPPYDGPTMRPHPRHYLAAVHALRRRVRLDPTLAEGDEIVASALVTSRGHPRMLLLRVARYGEPFCEAWAPPLWVRWSWADTPNRWRTLCCPDDSVRGQLVFALARELQRAEGLTRSRPWVPGAVAEG